ncbi:hypothetical protein NDU88_006081 [Pleurodeles waltl]|uniref:Uncharacterized protein n=1 Tax=Pleurodeles waltl TaxID=8319 RepID=A0AAV7QKX8_PLEWA|nr:hypothetical protein NDU88_006081 [Pleurodeles waltl]
MSSVSSHSLTTEERREEREFQLQIAKLNLEAEERKAEREAERAAKQAEAERALAEKKCLLAHELSLKELAIKVRQSQSSSDGSSIHAGLAGERKVRTPKNGVPSFVLGDNIDKWLAAYEVALRAHGVSEEQWWVALCWGPLSIVKEGWEKALKKPPQNVVSYMLPLRNQTQCFWKQAKSNLEASQEEMKEWYGQKATLVEFSPGNKVWVMEPVEPRALQDHWTGPFEVKERKGEATYLMDLKTPRNTLRVLHRNRLKPHFERCDVSLLRVTDEGLEEESEPLPDLLSVKESDGSLEGVDLSDSLTLEQRGECCGLLEQLSSLFSLSPRLTHLCVHDIDRGDSPPVKNNNYRLSD